ncbi:hypothetical protein [Pseudomonas graminis]|uniref:Uncharacterized protein n=1 Tax=Pseudomonas graminis TaxID=158627 RepID=A0A1I0G576_9PSED|nr:hypothetical protein [Pseudomonas graminis]SET65798.1 hypothetical protein SAMN05216197_11965 [Pseudomonas graminis]
MRQYVSLINFMLALGTAIQDYLPEDERANVPDLKSFLDEWASRTSLIELYRLRGDIRSYLVKHAAGDYTIDELFFYYDIGFVYERFGSEDPVFLAGVVQILDRVIDRKKAALARKYLGWIGFK